MAEKRVLTREDFEPTVGFLDDFDAAISPKSYFGKPPEKYESTEPVFHLILDGETLDEPEDKTYSIGKGWQVQNNGRSVVNSKAPDIHRFNVKARVMLLFERMCMLIGGGDKQKGQDFFVKRGIPMTDADCYAGLNFHWKNEKVKLEEFEGSNAPAPGKQKKTEVDVLLPSSYLGEGTGKAATQTTTGGTATAPPADVKALDDEVVKLAPEKTVKELKQACAKVEAIRTNKPYMGTVLNEQLLFARLEAEGRIMLDPTETDVTKAKYIKI
jgi:hypothetical protein